MSAGNRYAYLQWLANGAKDKSVELGFVFVYFYGLERRLLLVVGAAEVKLLIAELDRLVGIYGSHGSFLAYARRLKEHIQLRNQLQEPSDDVPSFDFPLNYELPPLLRLGLGRFARDQKPLPLAWALRWALSDPLISRRTPVNRCPDAFARAFATAYHDAHGDGLLLPHNKTKLKFNYNPASAGLRGGQNCQLEFNDIPDILAVTGPSKKMQAIVEQATCLIESYSRFLAKRNARAESVEACLMLPTALWPKSAAQKIRAIKDTVGSTMEPLTYGELLERLGSTERPAANVICDLARVLHENQIGIEPDVLAGARRPVPEDKIILFPLTSQVTGDRTTGEYRSSSLTVALSAALALLDGKASESDLQAVEKQIVTWSHLDADLQMRLRAQYRLQVCQPASLSKLKTKIASLLPERRLELGLALSSLAKADGIVSAVEVKFLERLYRMLQLDQQSVYSHLHGERDEQRSAGGSSDSLARQDMRVRPLDLDRIARLQRETETVSALLATVFVEEDKHEVASSESFANVDIEAEQESRHPANPSPLPGLDREHTAFLVLLLSRPVWSREELVTAATEMHVMLDGALERINDAALEVSGSLLIEGDDPVYIDKALLEIAAI